MTRLRGFYRWYLTCPVMHQALIMWSFMSMATALALLVEKLTLTPPGSTYSRWWAFGFVALAAIQIPCALLCMSPRRWTWWGLVACILAYAAVAIYGLQLVTSLGSEYAGDPGMISLADFAFTGKVMFVGGLIASAIFLAWLIRIRLRGPKPEPSIPAP